MQLPNTWKRRFPLLFAGIFVLSKLYDWFLDPIVKLNIENFAQAHHLDKVLVEDSPVTALGIWILSWGYPAISAIVSFLASNLFLGFVCGALIFTFWDPLSRYVSRLRGPPLKVEFPAEINSDAKYGVNKSSTLYISKDNTVKPDMVVVSKYFFDLTNITTKTIKNVFAQVHLIDNPLPFHLERRLVSRSGKAVFDIMPGYTEYVQLGFVHKYGRDRIAEHVDIVDPSVLKSLEKQWEGHTGFVITIENGHLRLLANDRLRLIVGIYGDDTQPRHHKFTINCKDKIEIFYNGLINMNEPLEPRRAKGTEEETQEKINPG
jgi:hypothetical protein